MYAMMFLTISWNRLFLFIYFIFYDHSYTAPDGTEVEVKFVANEYGYQPQSDLLPVPPEFPHPIPDFVLAQIKKAQEEDRGTRNEIGSGTYTYA